MVLVDTNIVVYLMLDGDRTSEAQKLYERDADWRSEAFIMVEFSNVLTTYVRAKALTHDQGMKLLVGADELVPILTSVPHARALEAAVRFGISAYDARFIALAMQTKNGSSAQFVGEIVDLNPGHPRHTDVPRSACGRRACGKDVEYWAAISAAVCGRTRFPSWCSA